MTAPDATVAALDGKDGQMRRVIDEARRQGWEATLTADFQHYALTPPDGKRPFRVRAIPADMTMVLRDMKDRGFQWPAPKREPPVPRPSAAPFAARPNPDVVHADITPAAPAPQSAGTVWKYDGKADDTDRLFAELKEARAYEQIAIDQLAQSVAALDRAQAKVNADRAELENWTRERETLKKRFDAAFGA